MVRMQVTLDGDDHRKVRDRAEATGVSVAEYIRRVLAADLRGHQPAAPDVHALTRLGDSGHADVARLKKDYLATAVRRDRPPPTTG